MRYDKFYSEPPYDVNIALRHKKDDELKRFLRDIDRSEYTMAQAVRDCLLFGVKAIGYKYTDPYGTEKGKYDNLENRTIKEIKEKFNL